MARTAKKRASTRKTARKTTGRGSPARKTTSKTARKATGKKWSAEVTEHSDALDLKDHVFQQSSAAAIAKSLKRSAERSHRRKSSPYRSAMSMLTFYINRAGKNLSAARRRKLDNAKDELRKAFGKSAT